MPLRRLAFFLVGCVAWLSAGEVTPFKWSGAINVPDPTSVTVDEQGDVYVASTSRRKAGDLDIREHAVLIPQDVALTSPLEKLALYQKELAPGKLRGPRGGLKDHNGDGSVDWKDLTVPQERIYKLTDTDGDGIADKITVFAEGFNSPISGIAAGVLYFDGWVYVTAIPDLWRLKDTDGDGVADVKEIVVTGFGAHIAYAGHDMHGLRLGPDGRIYWTVGDKGTNVTSKEGKHFVFPHTGAVLRCEPDGAGFEVFASGIRNLQEIAFDDFANVIGVDNDADQPKERERLVYLLEGSDSGWRNQHQYMKLHSRWMRENMWMPAGQPNQPLYTTPPLANYSDGPAGFLHEPGQAMDGTLRGHFLLDQFPKGKMDAFTLEPAKDSFKQVGLRTVHAGIMGIGMAWAPNGKAYFADWMGGYPLDGKGAVWCMDIAPHIDPSSAQFLAKPFTVAVPRDELLQLLGHRDQRVRVNASLRLDRLQAWDDMLLVALDVQAPRLARIHAIWGWGMGLRHGKVTAGARAGPLLEADDPEIRVQALKVLSETHPEVTLAKSMGAQLRHDSLRVRTQAGITVGKLGLGRTRYPELALPFDTFLRDASSDLQLPWLRHGIVSGLAGSQSAESLLARAQANDAGAIFATLALVRQRAPQVAALLNHPSELIVNEVARVIHDDEGLPQAWAALAARLEGRPMSDLATRRAINTNLRLGTAEGAARILRWYLAQSPDPGVALEALEALLVFDQPPLLDLVDGTAKSYVPRDAKIITAVLQTEQGKLLAITQSEHRARALELMVKYGLEVPFPVLLGMAEDLKLSSKVRLQTLRLLSAKADQATAITRTLLAATAEGNPSDVRIEAFTLLLHRDPTAGLEVAQRIINSKSAKLPEKQFVISSLHAQSDPAALKLVRELVDRLQRLKLDPGLKLEVYQLATDSPDLAVQAALKAYLVQAAKVGKMAAAELPYELLTNGGDLLRGRAIINEHLGANCIACHRVDADEGSEVGPILRTIGSQRTPYELAESLVEPLAKIVPGFGVETITLKRGSILSGNVLKETPRELEVRTLDGLKQVIPLATVAARSQPVSVMPPMLGLLTPTEIRDVVAYLSSLKLKKAKKVEAAAKPTTATK